MGDFRCRGVGDSCKWALGSQVLQFFPGKTHKNLAETRFGKPEFCHSAGPTTFDQPHCEKFQMKTTAGGCDFCSEKEKAHRHKQFCSAIVGQAGGSPDRVARGQLFICCVRNPRNINISSGHPAGRIGDRGDREIVHVPNVYGPFLVHIPSWWEWKIWEGVSEQGSWPLRALGVCLDALEPRNLPLRASIRGSQKGF